MPRAAVPRFHGGTGMPVLLSLRRSVFDYCRDFLGMRNVGHVARSGDFHLVALCELCIPALKVRIDRTVRAGHQHPAWLRSPPRRVDRALKLSAKLNTCERAMKAACSSERSAA